MGKDKSSIGGGGTRVTEHHSNGNSTDKDYVSGKCVAITDHDKNGSSHSHEVGHGFFGPFKGEKK